MHTYMSKDSDENQYLGIVFLRTISRGYSLSYYFVVDYHLVQLDLNVTERDPDYEVSF